MFTVGVQILSLQMPLKLQMAAIETLKTILRQAGMGQWFCSTASIYNRWASEQSWKFQPVFL